MQNKTYRLVALLLMGLVLSSCTIEESNVAVTTTQVSQPATTTTIHSETTTTSTVSEASVDLEEIEGSTTTIEPPKEYADPVGMASVALDFTSFTDSTVRVSEESRDPDKKDPLEGEVLWDKTKDLVGPCENGLIRMLGHLNTGEPFFNLVDDSERDRKHGTKDYGLKVGDNVSFVLADGTTCLYSVIEPLGVGIENVKRIEGQPAIYFLKDSTVITPIVYSLLDEVGERSIVSLWVSYAGPNNNEWKPPPNEIHRANNAVVFAELTEVLEK